MKEYIKRDIELLKNSSFTLREMLEDIVGIVMDAEYPTDNDESSLTSGIMDSNADDIDEACGFIEKAIDSLSLIINRLEHLNHYYERKN